MSSTICVTRFGLIAKRTAATLNVAEGEAHAKGHSTDRLRGEHHKGQIQNTKVLAMNSNNPSRSDAGREGTDEGDRDDDRRTTGISFLRSFSTSKEPTRKQEPRLTAYRLRGGERRDRSSGDALVIKAAAEGRWRDDSTSVVRDSLGSLGSVPISFNKRSTRRVASDEQRLGHPPCVPLQVRWPQVLIAERFDAGCVTCPGPGSGT